jgi:hypothetical protein
MAGNLSHWAQLGRDYVLGPPKKKFLLTLNADLQKKKGVDGRKSPATGQLGRD